MLLEWISGVSHARDLGMSYMHGEIGDFGDKELCSGLLISVSPQIKLQSKVLRHLLGFFYIVPGDPYSIIT